MPGMHLRFDISPQKFLEDLTQATYQAALKYRAGTSFVELELELWDVLREVIQKDMLVSEACGGSKLGVCNAARRVVAQQISCLDEIIFFTFNESSLLKPFQFGFESLS